MVNSNEINKYVIYDYLSESSKECVPHLVSNYKYLLKQESKNNNTLFFVMSILFEKKIEGVEKREAYGIDLVIFESSNVVENNNYESDIILKREIRDKDIINHIDRVCILTKQADTEFKYYSPSNNEYYEKISKLENEFLKSYLDRYAYFMLKEYYKREGTVSHDSSEYNDFNDGYIRDEHERQRDRILYSKSFRRMADKAQIFSNKGVHYRNRLSHSLEVANIAKGLANEINTTYITEKKDKINLMECEAIALAHDIGHTPFGHVGERAIENFLRTKFMFLQGNKNTKVIPFLYFKHNLQGIRVLEFLEECYESERGIGLSKSVLLGVVGHTRLPKEIKEKHEMMLYLNKFFFTGKICIEEDDLEKLENNKIIVKGSNAADIVALADEIAQRSHDLDDALAAEIIDISYVLQILENYTQRKDASTINSLVEEIKRIKSETDYEITDKQNIYRSRVASKIVKELIHGVNYVDGKVELKSSETHLMSILDDLINSKVICSRDVTLFDDKGERVISSLLNEYCDNIMLLPISYRKKITNALFNSNIETAIDLTNVDFEMKNIIKKIMNLEHSQDKNSKYKRSLEYTIYNIDLLLVQEIIIQGVIDYIAGMSDEFALDKYKEICLLA